MKYPWLLVVLALGLGAVGGFFLGKIADGNAKDPLAGDSTEKTDRPRSATPRDDTRPARSGSAHRKSEHEEHLDHFRKEVEKLSLLSPEERRLAMVELVTAWAKEDPANAIRLFARDYKIMREMIDFGDEGQTIAHTIFREWAKTDPRNVMSWIDANPSELTWQICAAGSLFNIVATTDIDSALEMHRKLDPKLDNEVRDTANEAMAEAYGKQDFAAAKKWIGELPEYERAAALASAIRGLVTRFPEQAVQELTAIPDNPSRDFLAQHVVETIARDHPMLAASLMDFPTDANRKNEVAMILMKEWTAQDPAAALAYTESLPSGTAYDRAMAAFVRNNSGGNPVEMLRLAETITHDDAHDLAVMAAASRWLEADPAAARAYIRQADTISDRTRELILNSPPFN